MGYPSAVGLIIHVTDSLAIRPEFAFTQSSLETEVSSSAVRLELNDSDIWSYGVGISALVYLSKDDDLRTYLSPRFAYSRSATDTTSPTSGSLPVVETEIRGSTFSIAASFGAQYSLNRRFSVFGELGAAYSDSETTSTSSGGSGVPFAIRISSSGSGWGLRSGVGVIWYF
jgi:opacity protein-like surface antigen